MNKNIVSNTNSKIKPMKKFAIYLRKSRIDTELEALGQGETLARHEAALDVILNRDKIDKRFVDTYREIVSGESISARPEMCRLLEAVESNEYTAVYCMEIERLARGDGADQARIIKAFSQSCTEIRTPAKIYDLNTESDENYAEFGLFLSRFEYKTIKRRLANGRKASFLEGVYQNATPFGYISINSGRRRVLKPDPETAPMVRYAFEQRAAGASLYSIASDLHNKDVNRRKKFWDTGAVSDIIKRKSYIGIQTINGVEHPFNCEPIIEESLWYAANAVPNKHSTRSDRIFANPLAGLLRCKHCGYMMRMTHPTHKRMLFSHSVNRICEKPHAASFKIVMGQIEDAIRAEIENFDIMLGEVDESKAQKIICELNEQRRRRDRLLDSFESDTGLYTVEEYVTRKRAYDTKIADLQRQLEEENNKVPVDKEARKIAFYKALEESDPEEKNRLLKAIIREITFSRPEKGGEVYLEIFFK